MATHQTTVPRVHDIRHQLRILRVYYPFSVTIVATSQTPHLHRSLLCRGFFAAAFTYNLLNFLLFIRNLLVSSATLSIFKISSFNLICWLGYFTFNLIYVYLSRKEKVEKLILEIEHLDTALQYREVDISVLKQLCWIIATFSLHGSIFTLMIPLRSVFRLISSLYVNMSRDAEVLLFSSFATLLTARLKHFNDYLYAILNNTQSNQNSIDILLCFKLLSRVLKKINTVFQYQIFVTIVIAFLHTIRCITVLLILKDYSGVVYYGGLEVYHVFGMYSYVMHGHRLVAQVNRADDLIAALCEADLDECTRATGRKMLLLQGVSARRLMAGGVVSIDGLLPLRAMLVAVATIVISLQLGFRVD